MIGHDDPGIEMIGRPMAGDHDLPENGRQFRSGQQALAMTGIKEVVEFRSEFTMKGGTLGSGKLLGISI